MTLPTVNLPRLNNANAYQKGHEQTADTNSDISNEGGEYFVDIAETDSAGTDFRLIGNRERRVLPPYAKALQERLRAQWPSLIAQARDLSGKYPDSLQGLVDLLDDMPGDYETWREILAEPYG